MQDQDRTQDAAPSPALGVDPALRAAVWAGGSDAPEKPILVAGFLPLTDCASLVVAATEGFDRKHGIRIVLSREPS